jgi:hypothetical protein
MLPFLAAAASAIYYWYSSPTFMEALGFGSMAGNLVRSVTFIFIAFWLIRAVNTSGQRIPQPRAA